MSKNDNTIGFKVTLDNEQRFDSSKVEKVNSNIYKCEKDAIDAIESVHKDIYASERDYDYEDLEQRKCESSHIWANLYLILTEMDGEEIPVGYITEEIG